MCFFACFFAHAQKPSCQDSFDPEKILLRTVSEINKHRQKQATDSTVHPVIKTHGAAKTLAKYGGGESHAEQAKKDSFDFDSKETLQTVVSEIIAEHQQKEAEETKQALLDELWAVYRNSGKLIRDNLIRKVHLDDHEQSWIQINLYDDKYEVETRVRPQPLLARALGWEQKVLYQSKYDQAKKQYIPTIKKLLYNRFLTYQNIHTEYLKKKQEAEAAKEHLEHILATRHPGLSPEEIENDRSINETTKDWFFAETISKQLEELLSEFDNG